MATDYDQALRERWALLMPAMKIAVRKAAEDARGLGYAKPLKDGPLPSKGVPIQSYCVPRYYPPRVS